LPGLISTQQTTKLVMNLHL